MWFNWEVNLWRGMHGNPVGMIMKHRSSYFIFITFSSLSWPGRTRKMPAITSCYTLKARHISPFDLVDVVHETGASAWHMMWRGHTSDSLDLSFFSWFSWWIYNWNSTSIMLSGVGHNFHMPRARGKSKWKPSILAISRLASWWVGKLKVHLPT